MPSAVEWFPLLSRRLRPFTDGAWMIFWILTAIVLAIAAACVLISMRDKRQDEQDRKL